MDKGQHLRLLITDSSAKYVVALSTDLSFHLSAQTEEDSTKDSGDTSGNTTYNEYDVTKRSGNIDFGALIGVGTDPYSAASGDDPEVIGGYSFADWINKVNDTIVNWKIVTVSGAKNRDIEKTICSGQGKLTNLRANAVNQQKATYSGTINIYGAVTVGND